MSTNMEWKGTEWNGVEWSTSEGTYKAHPVPLPDHFRATQKLKHSNDGVIQMPPAHFQAQDINHFSRKPALEGHSAGRDGGGGSILQLGWAQRWLQKQLEQVVMIVCKQGL